MSHSHSKNTPAQSMSGIHASRIHAPKVDRNVWQKMINCTGCHVMLSCSFQSPTKITWHGASQHEATQHGALRLGQISILDHVDKGDIVGRQWESRQWESRQAGSGHSQQLLPITTALLGGATEIRPSNKGSYSKQHSCRFLAPCRAPHCRLQQLRSHCITGNVCRSACQLQHVLYRSPSLST